MIEVTLNIKIPSGVDSMKLNLSISPDGSVTTDTPKVVTESKKVEPVPATPNNNNPTGTPSFGQLNSLI